MISRMAYGIELSEQVKLTLTESVKTCGAAINSGEGGGISEELDIAEKYILPFCKTKWSNREAKIKRADMIKIKVFSWFFHPGGTQGGSCVLSWICW